MFKRFWWLFPLGVVLGPILGTVVAGVIAYVQPKMFESHTILQVRPKIEVTEGSGAPPAMSPNFWPTEFEVVKSQKNLDLVIDRLDLINRWSMDRQTVLQHLKPMITATNIRGTDLLEIRVRSSSPGDAKLIAEQVADAYRTRRTELENERARQALAELQDEVLKQQDLVEDKRKALTMIIRQEKISYRSPRQGTMQPGSTPARRAQAAAMRFAEVEAEVIMLESQIDTLLRFDGDQLMTYAAGLNLPDNIVRTLHPQYLEAQRQLEGFLLAGLGADHPNVRQQREVVDAMRGNLDEGIVALRETLRAKLELAKEQMERLKARPEPDPDPQASPVARAAFDDARSEFETAQRMLEQLKIKEISEQMQHRISEDPVIVHEDPVMAMAPVSPNVRLTLLFGAAAGLALGCIAPLGLIPLLHAMSTRNA